MHRPPAARPHSTSLDWGGFDAVLFDLDGVITPTADIHERAWAVLFADHDYRDGDYHAHIDGKPRAAGVRDFLAAKGIELPEGTADDPPDTLTLNGLGNRKNLVFNEILDAEGIEAYPGSIRLLDHLDRIGVESAVVSSSKNARRVLAAAGLAERFEVVVDGLMAAGHGIPGKPRPDTFWFAAEQLGVEPSGCAVIEDALSGVEAGRAGGFALVVGVDRGDQADALAAAGADVVVSDLADTLDADHAHDTAEADGDRSQ
jgi:beta-phosphoglucomutase family hydrolase